MELNKGIPSEIIIPQGTILFRIGNNDNNKSPFRFFSYLYGQLDTQFNSNKNAFADRTSDLRKNPEFEFYEVKKELPLIIISYNSLTLEDMNQNEEIIYQKLLHAVDTNISPDLAFCYKSALSDIFQNPNHEKEYGYQYKMNEYDKCNNLTQFSKNVNPDLRLAEAFVTLSLTGWFRSGNNIYDLDSWKPSKIDELMLPIDSVITYLDKKIVMSPTEILVENKVPELMAGKTQPKFITHYANSQSGGSKCDYKEKYIKYKKKYLLLKN